MATPPAVVLRSSAQAHFRRARLEYEVVDLIRRWQEDGAPLGLTQELFAQLLGCLVDSDVCEDLFRTLDTDANRKVDALEVLSASVLLATGSVDGKVDLLFSIFDFSGADRLNFDELNIMVTSLCRPLNKVCRRQHKNDKDTAREEGEAFVQACRQCFDAHNVPYEKYVTREQVKRWAKHDIDAAALLQTFQQSKTALEVEDDILKREESQAHAFQMLCADGTSEVALTELLRSDAMRRAFLDQAADGCSGAEVTPTATAQREADYKAMLESMAAMDDSGVALVTATRFTRSAHAWNAFAAVDFSGAGRIQASDVPALLWLSQAERAEAPEDMTEEALQQSLSALCLGVDDGVTRAAWVAACATAAR